MPKPTRANVCREVRRLKGTVCVNINEPGEAGMVDLSLDAPKGTKWLACDLHSVTVNYRRPIKDTPVAQAAWQSFVDDAWRSAQLDIERGVTTCGEPACEFCEDY